MSIWTTENKGGGTFFIHTIKSKIPKTFRVKEWIALLLSLFTWDESNVID